MSVYSRIAANLFHFMIVNSNRWSLFEVFQMFPCVVYIKWAKKRGQIAENQNKNDFSVNMVVQYFACFTRSLIGGDFVFPTKRLKYLKINVFLYAYKHRN